MTAKKRKGYIVYNEQAKTIYYTGKGKYGTDEISAYIFKSRKEAKDMGVNLKKKNPLLGKWLIRKV